jgi:hypothetical protein
LIARKNFFCQASSRVEWTIRYKKILCLYSAQIINGL